MLAKRLALGLTQKQVADPLGLTATQIGRYEKGIDRIGASRLHEIAIMMEVSAGSFFPPHGAGGAGTDINGVVTADVLTKLLKDPYTIKLLQAFAPVRGKTRRAYVIEFVETFASHQTTTLAQR